MGQYNLCDECVSPLAMASASSETSTNENPPLLITSPDRSLAIDQFSRDKYTSAKTDLADQDVESHSVVEPD